MHDFICKTKSIETRTVVHFGCFQNTLETIKTRWTLHKKRIR